MQGQGRAVRLPGTGRPSAALAGQGGRWQDAASPRAQLPGSRPAAVGRGGLSAEEAAWLSMPPST